MCRNCESVCDKMFCSGSTFGNFVSSRKLKLSSYPSSLTIQSGYTEGFSWL